MDPAPDFERFTGQARRAVWLAYQEAQRFDHDYLASEHLLAGLVREGSAEVAHVFREQNVATNDVLQKLESALIEADPAPTAPPVFLTPRANRVLAQAIELAGREHVPLAGPGHLLLALIDDPDNAMRALLESVGLDLGRAERSLRQAGAGLNRDVMVQSAPAVGDAGRVDPTAAQLSSLLAGEMPQADFQLSEFADQTINPAIAESDFQLFLTQLILAITLGLTAGYLTYGSVDGMAGAAVVFALIACFRNSLLGALAGATLGGMIAQRAHAGRPGESALETLAPLVIVGAFLGSFVGNFWRRFCPTYLHPSTTHQKPPGVV